MFKADAAWTKIIFTSLKTLCPVRVNPNNLWQYNFEEWYKIQIHFVFLPNHSACNGLSSRTSWLLLVWYRTFLSSLWLSRRWAIYVTCCECQHCLLHAMEIVWMMLKIRTRAVKWLTSRIVYWCTVCVNVVNSLSLYLWCFTYIYIYMSCDCSYPGDHIKYSSIINNAVFIHILGKKTI